MVNRDTIRTVFITTAVFIAVVVAYQIYRHAVRVGDVVNVPVGYADTVANADLNVVEFIDYGCRYCREIHPIFMDAVRRDGRVNVIPRPLPYIDGDAPLLVYAAAAQGKFIQMHNILISETWSASVQNMRALADRLGIDALKLQDDFNKRATKNKILNNIDLHKHIGTGATPTFVIGKKQVFVPENKMPTADDFIEMFNTARTER